MRLTERYKCSSVALFPFFVACLVLSGCAGWPVGSEATARSTVPVVSSVAPTDPGVGYKCPGIPDSALDAMLGTDYRVEVYPGNQLTCSIWVDDSSVSASGLVLFVKFWFSYEGSGPWDKGNVASGSYESDFSFEGVEGEGEAVIDEDRGDGEEVRYGSTVFTCGDRYLVLSVYSIAAVRGDVKGNLVNLTHSTLPWLCGDEPVPGRGQTMEEIRPDYAQPTAGVESGSGAASDGPSEG